MLVNEELADLVWEACARKLITDEAAKIAWSMVTLDPRKLIPVTTSGNERLNRQIGEINGEQRFDRCKYCRHWDAFCFNGHFHG